MFGGLAVYLKQKLVSRISQADFRFGIGKKRGSLEIQEPPPKKVEDLMLRRVPMHILILVDA